ncbi:MAG: hypothetical protein ACYTFT_11375 [Planctomycetota bacterium]
MAAKTRKAVLAMDDLFFESRIGEVLDALGVPYVTARTDAAFCERLEEVVPAAIFVDLMAKRLTPFVAMQFVRTTPEIVGTPIIAFSIHIRPGDAEEARDLGCAEFFVRSELEEVLPEICLLYLEPLGDPVKIARAREEITRHRAASQA